MLQLDNLDFGKFGDLGLDAFTARSQQRTENKFRHDLRVRPRFPAFG
jgi:hypothetical protein